MNGEERGIWRRKDLELIRASCLLFWGVLHWLTTGVWRLFGSIGRCYITLNGSFRVWDMGIWGYENTGYGNMEYENMGHGI